jgi:hypothetical protein
MLGGRLHLRVRDGQRGLPTVREIYPVEMRAMTISLFFALGALAGAGAPALFG